MQMNKEEGKMKKKHWTTKWNHVQNKRKNWKARKKIDQQEVYARRNCILIHGIAENKEENTDQQAMDFINDNLDIKID